MKKPPPNLGRSNILQAYEHHLGEVAGLSAKTCANHARDVSHFLEAARIGADRPLAQLTPADLTGYLTVRSASCQPASLRQVAGSLRQFLRFARQQGWISWPLSQAVPAIACGAKNDLPAYLSGPQLELLLASWDRTTAQGRRDRAIGLCLARLGMRAGEVAALRLQDLDWRQGIVRIHRAKNCHGATMPLLAEVAQSIASYLREGRPACGHRQVFLSHRPVGPMNGQAISHVIAQALRRCGLRVPRAGAHLLRHTLASHLVQNGASLKEVADVLRHRHLNSAGLYAHLDVAHLRWVAQPWPKEVVL